ncbi:Superkiller viralicidic activity 2-like 2 [Eufriesea mexicana]|uniref:superkiller viralicidic activity 2-like 2 n=1 Tax=Eufriesea mexicana TaxID=516756 RepID=UPI00083BBF92|nr:PREDICTED: superkiller viralicidic activity 2-like 2 [Eufriesea mexicana]OAD61477.1 Superkiller viralicidic activity 2-like 2 [Eufriesea mexicana]
MANFTEDLFDVFEEAEDIVEVIPTPVKPNNEDLNTPLNEKKTDAESGTKREFENDSEEFIRKKLRPDPVLEDLNIEELAPRIKIHVIETIESCTHEVAVPPDYEYVPLENKQSKSAKEYKFILDPFQKEAILCIENNQSVLVSAHTSAGKTVVAEYAIACSLRDKQRVIYTTPIKALSNQKYREFYEEFKDVGLVTGDVTINPTASVLIMTTEILRNMLYRGSEVMREVGWVIFDEIHYMRDKERGVVWEETLILLPDNVHYVFLSATIPNARQFVEWVAHLHKQPCHVVYTDYRPTPLQHYIFPVGGDGIHLVVDEMGQFKEENFNRAMACLQHGDAAKGDTKGRKGGIRPSNAGQTNIFKMVKMIMERNFAPVIIFSFSKKDCEIYAMQLAKLDLNTLEEKKLVDEVFNNAMDVLNEEDRRLPQVENVLPLLRRGIGIHHGGLLPILKETVEILFGEGLIKALFATETFAMGLNMPARTVLFTASRKFDGKDFRWITSGEYIQMSGRAGRRGLDEKGIVILMIDEQVSPVIGKAIVQGKPDPINSAFHLTYNMVLNLLRVEEINPEYMLERSFYQFQNQASIPDLYNKVKGLQTAFNAVSIDGYNQISSYHDIREQLERLSTAFRSFLTKPEYLLPFLQPGRLVKVKNENDTFDWGIIVNFKKKNPKNPTKENTVIIIDILLHISKDSSEGCPVPCCEGEEGDMEVVPVIHTLISQISSLRLYYPKDLRPSDNRKSVLKTILEVKKRFPDGPPLLNPITDMHIEDEAFKDIVKKIEVLEERLYAHPLHKDPNVNTLYEQFLHKEDLGNQLKQAKLELKQAKSILQMDELKCRKRVLRRMAYCTASDLIELKGRVACELNGADELLMTEMIFNGLFNSLSVPQMVALISCFVCDDKSNEMPKSTEELSGPLRQMQDLARRIAKVSTEANLELDEDTYVERFKPYLMDVVYAWCKGATFLQICKMTDIFEGSIIRCMRRLEEVLRQLCQSAKNIGNTDLENKFSEAIKLIKRDIVFAASLYL